MPENSHSNPVDPVDLDVSSLSWGTRIMLSSRWTFALSTHVAVVVYRLRRSYEDFLVSHWCDWFYAGRDFLRSRQRVG